MKRGEIYWARYEEPIGRRPVIVLTPTHALGYLTSITVAQITTHIRGSDAEVRLDRRDGLVRPSVANLFNIDTLERPDLDQEPIGVLPPWRTHELDAALCFALDIRA